MIVLDANILIRAVLGKPVQFLIEQFVSLLRVLLSNKRENTFQQSCESAAFPTLTFCQRCSTCNS